MSHTLHNTLQVGWHVLLDETEWEKDEPVTIPGSEDPATRQPAAKRRAAWLTAGLLLALALAVGVRFWQMAQSGLAAVEQGVTHTMALESQAQEAGDTFMVDALLDPQADADWRSVMEQESTLAQGREATVELLDFTLHGDRLLAQVRVTQREGGVVYRESRFYRETPGGWLCSQPTAELWGSPRRLESAYFFFHFRQRDGTAVAEAARLLDEAYAHTHTALGLLLPVASTAGSKVQVYVAAGGEAIGDIWYESGDDLWVVSPLLLRLPERVSEGQALAEMIAFSLRRGLVNRAVSPLDQPYQPSPEFLSGLRLWLAWDGNMPLDSYRREMVAWLYANRPLISGPLPIAYWEICEIFGAWQVLSPVMPFLFQCAQPSPSVSSYFTPPTALYQLPLTVYWEALGYAASGDPLTGQWSISQQGQPVAMATVLEYAAHTYGRASIPDLLQAIRTGESWHTVAPQVFGVSAKQFEAGWWVWLAEEYRVDTVGLIDKDAVDMMRILGRTWHSAAVWQGIDSRQMLAKYQARLP